MQRDDLKTGVAMIALILTGLCMCWGASQTAGRCWLEGKQVHQVWGGYSCE